MINLALLYFSFDSMLVPITSLTSQCISEAYLFNSLTGLMALCDMLRILFIWTHTITEITALEQL